MRTDLLPISTLSPVAPGAPVADARQEAFDRALSGLLGKTIKGEVLARLTDGSALVRVAGNTARMMLPQDAVPGASVALTLVALEPRATFEVGPERTLAFAEAAPQRATASAAALQAQNVPAELLPQADPRATPTTLSDTARALTAVLANLKPPSSQAALVARTPLVGEPTRDAAQLAAALGDALGASGLFYESHLAAWTSGERPLAALAREPQMQAGFGAERSGAALAGDAAQLVNLQLAVQEQGRVGWEGQLWPGQPMRWEIEKKDARDSGAHDTDAAPAWRSTLRLRFPQLGEIEATVVLAGGQVRIELRPDAGDAVRALRAHAASLSGAFEHGLEALVWLRIHAAAEGQRE